jgi:hypothetical protein
MMTFSLMPLGTLPMGFLADSLGTVSVLGMQLEGIQAAQFGAGLLLVVFIFAVTVLNPAYRQLEQNDLKRFAEMAVERVRIGQGEGTVWQQLRGSMKYERGAHMAGQYGERPGEPDTAAGGGSG